MRRRLLAALVALGIASSAAAEPALAPIELHTTPIETFQSGSDETRFGALEFRGGLVLSARDGDFGSLSGLDFAPDGTLYAVADTGFWFSARLVESDGRLTGIADTRFGQLLLEDGKPPKNKFWSDAESLRFTMRGGKPVALVSFEGETIVRAYDGPDFAATPTKLKLPSFVNGVSRNKGLESIAVAPQSGPLGGATVVIAERSLNAAGNHRGFVLTGPRAGTFAIRATDGYDISDATFLPDGNLVILERQFSFSNGFAIRLRRISQSAIRPGTTVDGTVLMEADNRYQIDNLEGIAARMTPGGETLIDLVSDNNRNLFQRTLILQFALLDETPPLPRPRPQ